MYALTPELALVQTVDFFSPMTDDPYVFGQIAAANALSDVYAMGGTPLTALNIACYATCISPNIMAEVLRGGADKCLEAGVVVIGGHTVENADVKFGLSVTGVINPNAIISNAGAKVGDHLILTKQLGTGIIYTASKAELAEKAHVEQALHMMAELNGTASEILKQYAVSGGTDITGFGLLGHSVEVAQASGVELEIWSSAVSLLEGVNDYAAMGLVPAGAYRNAEHFGQSIHFEADMNDTLRDALYDPQTSGGLLFALSSRDVEVALAALHQAGIKASCIGQCISGRPGHVVVK